MGRRAQKSSARERGGERGQHANGTGRRGRGQTAKAERSKGGGQKIYMIGKWIVMELNVLCIRAFGNIFSYCYRNKIRMY